MIVLARHRHPLRRHPLLCSALRNEEAFHSSSARVLATPRRVSNFGLRFFAVQLSLLCLLSSVSVYGQWDELNFRKGTFFGGTTNVGSIAGLAQDSAGYIYGLANGTEYPTTASAFQTQRKGAKDIAVFKLTPDLKQLVWCTYLGGAAGYGDGSNDLGTDIAVTPQGEVVVTGWTVSTDFPITSGANYCSAEGGTYDSIGIFVTKFNSTGSALLFSRILGYTHAAIVNPRLCLNSQSEIFMCATVLANASSPPLPPWDVTANAYQSTFSGNSDMALIKLSSSGSTMYGSYLGSADNSDRVFDVYYAKSKLYLSGLTYSASSAASSFPMLSSGQAGYVAIVADDNGSALNFRKCFVYNSYVTSVNVRGLAYDVAHDQLNLMGWDVSHATFYMLDSGLSQVVYAKPLSASQNYGDIVIANKSRKYLTSNSSIFELDSSGTFTLWGSILSGTQSSTNGCRAIIRPGNECTYNVLVGSTTSSTAYKTTRDVYQPSRYNAGTTPGICMLGKSQADTLRMTLLPICGTVLFSCGTVPCPYTSMTWDFNDGTQKTVTTDTVRHTYKQSGLYQIQLKISYPDRDTVVHDTSIYVKTTASIQCSPKTVYRCANDTAALVLTASGATRYEWHPGTALSDSMIANPTARPTKNMKYYVRGYDANGCFADDSIQVYITSVKAQLNVSDTVLCEGASVELKASGGSEFAWFPSQGLSSTKLSKVVAKPSQTTEYAVVVNDAGCRDTARVRVRIAHPPRLLLSESPVICLGGSATLSARAVSNDTLDVAGMSYHWSPQESLSGANSPNPTASPAKTTLYTCIATNKYGCVRIDSVMVQVQNSLDLRLSPDTLSCRGSALFLKARGGARYSWSPKDGLDDSTSSSPTCVPDRDMHYTVITWSGEYATATCRDTAVMNVRVYDRPRVHASGSITVCPSSSVVLSSTLDSTDGAVPVFERVWRTSDGQVIGRGASLTVSPDSSTMYIVSCSNAQGCESSDTVAVTVSNTLQVQAVGPSVVSSGSTVHLSVAHVVPAARYEWLDASKHVIASTDTVSVSLSTASWFYVHAQSGGCEGWDSLFVDVQTTVPVEATDDVSVCEGTVVILGVKNPQPSTDYVWMNEDASWQASGAQVSFTALHTEIYVVKASQGSKVSSDTVRVWVYALPHITTRDTALCPGSRLKLDCVDSSRSNSYEWRDESGTIVSEQQSFEVDVRGEKSYTVIASTVHGCRDSSVLHLGIIPKTSIQWQIKPSADSVLPGDVVALDLLLSASQSQESVGLRAQLRVPKKILTIEGALSSGADLVVTLDTLVDIESQPTLVRRVYARVLAGNMEDGILRCTQVSSSLDAQCAEIAEAECVIHMASMCGSQLLNLEFNRDVLQVAPNPAGTEVTIRSSSTVELVDALGRPVDMRSAEHSLEDGLHSWKLRDLSPGMYYLRSTGSTTSRALLVVVAP